MHFSASITIRTMLKAVCFPVAYVCVIIY